MKKYLLVNSLILSFISSSVVFAGKNSEIENFIQKVGTEIKTLGLLNKGRAKRCQPIRHEWIDFDRKDSKTLNQIFFEMRNAKKQIARYDSIMKCLDSILEPLHINSNSFIEVANAIIEQDPPETCDPWLTLLIDGRDHFSKAQSGKAYYESQIRLFKEQLRKNVLNRYQSN